MNLPTSSRVFVRPATPGDVPVLLEMKSQLQAAHAAEFTLRATKEDWLRDGFGPEARFAAFVAADGSTLVGMITCSERYYTGWGGSTLYIQDIFVAANLRKRGIGKMLLARVAVHALERGCPCIELMVHKDNAARRLYKRSGFKRVDEGVSYVAGAETITVLAGSFPGISRFPAAPDEPMIPMVLRKPL